MSLNTMRRILPLILCVVASTAHAQTVLLLDPDDDVAAVLDVPATLRSPCSFIGQVERIAGQSDGSIAALTTANTVEVCDFPGDPRLEVIDLNPLTGGQDVQDLCGTADGRLAVLTAEKVILILSGVIAPVVDATIVVDARVSGQPTLRPALGCFGPVGVAVLTTDNEIIAFRQPDDPFPPRIPVNLCASSLILAPDVAGTGDGHLVLADEFSSSLFIFDPADAGVCGTKTSWGDTCGVSFNPGHVAGTEQNGIVVLEEFDDEVCVFQSPSDTKPVFIDLNAQLFGSFNATDVGGFTFGEGPSECTDAPDGTPCSGDSDDCTLDECVEEKCAAVPLPNCPVLPSRPASHEFGSSVALTARHMVVGAPASEETYVFDREADGTFVEREQNTPIPLPFTNPTSPLGTLSFGAAVAIDGDTVVVGAPPTDPAASEARGSASVFVFNGTFWNLQATLTTDDARCEEFGSSVAISRNQIVVGAPVGSAGGCAVVFERLGAAWNEVVTLTSGAANITRFGASVDIFKDTAIVGAPGTRSAPASSCSANGAAFVFVRDGSGWRQQDRLDEPLTASCFGTAVGVGAATAMVGAPGDDSKIEDGGAVYVFERTADVWASTDRLEPKEVSAGDAFGSALDLLNDSMLASSPGVAAFLFVRDTSIAFNLGRAAGPWAQVRRYQPPPTAPPEEIDYGRDVALGPTDVAAGAPLQDDEDLPDTGAVYPVTRGDGTTTTTTTTTTVTSTSTTTTGSITTTTFSTTTTTTAKPPRCAQPVTSGANPAASDCLFILRTSVGTVICDPVCACDTNGVGGTTASDALVCLKKAVGQAIELNCPSPCQ